MSPLPDRFIDRWENRHEPGSGAGAIYWHILLSDYPEIQSVAREVQDRLSGFTGFHMTPLDRLHATTLLVGPADSITKAELQTMFTAATHTLAKLNPPTVTLGRILYHPEAITLELTPESALLPIRNAVIAATTEAIGPDRITPNHFPWTPHVTLCYSTSHQPAEPIVATLDKKAAGPNLTINSVSLVTQRGPEKHWDWHSAGIAHIGEPISDKAP